MLLMKSVFINVKNGMGELGCWVASKHTYFELSFIGMYSEVTHNNIEKPYKRFIKNIKVKLVFTSDKLRQTFSCKDSYPSVLNSKVVYKFVRASCNASYVGQMHWHLRTRIFEHFGKHNV